MSHGAIMFNLLQMIQHQRCVKQTHEDAIKWSIFRVTGGIGLH